MRHASKIIACFFVVIACFFSTSAFVFANTAPLTMQQVQDEKAQLQQQLQDIENQIAQYEKDLVNIKGQKNTLANKITQLKKQQATLSLRMKSTSLQISDMTRQISNTQALIDRNTARIVTLQSQVADDLQWMFQNDHHSLFFLLLSKHTLFDFLAELQNMKLISIGLNALLSQTHQANEELTKDKQALNDQQEIIEQLLSVQQLQQQQLSGSVGEQNTLLKETKGKEKNYQVALSDTQKQAAKIRTRLYQLLDVGKQITFGQAVDIAKWVSGQTGVRASFVLAILTQESNLGRNVGTCNRPGDPASKGWKVIMKPTRDQEPFLQITKELGLDPDTTAVSCPMHDKKGNQIGWGGAMGPAQFIPSTWMGYKDKVTAITGKSANPWDIKDAFLASAIKLAAGGAKSESGEWAAAMRYFSGSTNVRFRFYGDNVVATAAQYQKDMDALAK